MTYTIGDFFILEVDSIHAEGFSERWKLIDPIKAQVPYYSFLESVKPVDSTFVYFYIYKKDHLGNEIPCARVYMQRILFNEKNIRLNSKILSFLVKSFLKLHSFRLIVFGNTLAVDFSPVHYVEKQIDVKSLTRLMCQLAGRFKNDVVILKDIPAQLDAEIFKAENFESYTTDLTMTLSIRKTWTDFDDYLKDLTKKYRKRAEKILFKGKDLYVKKLSLAEFNSHALRIRELLNEVVGKQMIKIGIIDEKYIEEYMKRFPDSFSLHGVFLNEKLIAFYSGIDREKMLEIHYIGMDYTFNDSHALYFNILFFAVRQAIAQKKESIELGRTAREAKASLGAEAVFFNDFIKINHPLARMLTRSLTGVFQKSVGDKWMERKPLKPSKT